MLTRTLLIAATSAAVVVGAAACTANSTQTAPSTSPSSASTSQPSMQPPTPVTVTVTSTIPTAAGGALTREPCELLTPALAKEYAGDDAAQQNSVGDPPQSVGPSACYYVGSAGSVLFSIDPLPTDPDAPVNHFHVITPDNELPGLTFKAYRFGAGESVVVVKDGLLLEFKVSNDQGVEANWDDDVKLAEAIVPRVG